jgi:hypothetical protein
LHYGQVKGYFSKTLAILNGGQGCLTQFWKRTKQGPSQPSLVSILHNGFRGEDLNMKSLWCSMNDGWIGMPSTVKSSHGLWLEELMTFFFSIFLCSSWISSRILKCIFVFIKWLNICNNLNYFPAIFQNWIIPYALLCFRSNLFQKKTVPWLWNMFNIAYL